LRSAWIITKILPVIIARCCGSKSRRLRAFRHLGRKQIPAVLKSALSDDEMRDLELEENENRKSLTAAERRRTFASAKRLVEKREAGTRNFGPEWAKKDRQAWASQESRTNPCRRCCSRYFASIYRTR